MNIRAVFVLILFLLMAACAASPPEAAPPTPSVAPSATAAPAVPTPTLTPEPTAVPTLTADQLRDLRATAVLTTLPGYDPAHYDALLPLARHLWGEEYVIDPADVAIVVGETAVRVNAASDSYPPGTLFLWRGAELLLLLPTAPDQTIEPGQVTLLGETVQTWVAYDGAGAMARFLHPAAAQWITPLDLSETGSFTLFLAQDISPDGQPGAATVWWANGGQPVELATSPNPGQSLPDYLTAAQHQLTQTTIEGQLLAAIAASDGTIQYTYNAENETWQEALNPAEAFYAQAQELYGEYSITLDPNVETGPNGEYIIYATNSAGDRYIAVRSAVDQEGKLVPVFAVESHIAANHQVIRGGRFTTPSGINVTFGYMDGTRELHQAEIVVRDMNQFLEDIKNLFPMPGGFIAVNSSLPPGAQYTTLSADQAAAITEVNVVVADSTQRLPGTTTMIELTYFQGDTYTGISYYLDPEKPERLIAYVNMNSGLLTVNTDRRNNQIRLHYGTVHSALMRGISFLHLKPGYRPTIDHEGRINVIKNPNENIGLTEQGKLFQENEIWENITIEKR